MRRLALIALLAVAGSACTIDVDIGISLAENGSGIVSVDVAADEEFHDLYQLIGDFEDLIASRGAEVGLSFDVTSGPITHYSAESRMVPADTLTGILEGLAPGIGDITISRTDDELVFDGRLNPLTSLDDVAPYFVDEDPSQFTDSVSVVVTMALPGDIATSTGTNDGSGLLTWSVPFDDSDTRLLARSGPESSSRSIPWTPIILFGTLGVAFAFLMSIRRRLNQQAEAATQLRPLPQPSKSTAPEDQPISSDSTPPEHQPVAPPTEPGVPASG